jgi:nucleolar protein 4
MEHSDRPTTTAEGSKKTLFVRSLPATATTEALTQYFSETFPIKHATVVLDPTTKQPKGYGFVTFADAEDAQRALTELNGSVFEGKKLKLEIAEPRKREIDEKVGKSVPIPSASKVQRESEKKRQETQPPKLIVRNLPWSINEPEQLAVLFRSYGKVKSAVIPKKGGRQAGFGFVVLRGRKNAEKAIEGVNGKEIDGRTVAVDWAVEKSVWEDLQQESSEVIGADDVNEEKEGPAAAGDENGSDQEEADDSDDDLEEDDDISMADATDDSELEDLGDDKAQAEDERNACTVFIRNLPFSATDESLYEHFTQFGPMRYARVVYDHETERPRGTAFVCFWKLEDAAACVREAPKHTDQAPTRSSTGLKHSVLEDENKDPSGKYTMDGRVLQISHAVSKREADKLTSEGSLRREARDKDRRRLFLLSEGTIPSNSPLYQKLSPVEVKMREASAKQRQKMVKENPMLHVSLTRLSVRNLPRSIDSKGLKALAREAVVGFATDVKKGLREPLSKEELTRSTDAMREAEKERKAKGKGVVKQAKIVFEGRDGSKIPEKTGAGRSRGYGFVEYTSHRCALMGLRWLNGHSVGASPSVKETDPAEKRKRLIVEFAIENAQVVKRRQEKEEKWQRKDEPDQQPRRREDDRKSKKGGDKRGSKRKRSDDDEKSTDAGSKAASEDKAGKDNQLAKRNRIIAKKRMARRTRKG